MGHPNQGDAIMPIIFSTIAPARPACPPPARIYFEAPDDALLARVTEKVASILGRHQAYVFHEPSEVPAGLVPVVLSRAEVCPELALDTLAATPTPPAEQQAPKAAPVTQQAGYAEVIECGNSYAKVKLKGEAFGSTRVGDIFYTALQQEATKAAPGELKDHQILAITTAYEQGVGKGHQAYKSGKEIANPYDSAYGCDLAWQYGYGEGKEQAQRGVKAAPQQEPVAWLNPWRADQVTTDYDAYGERGIPLYTAPQPAPATQQAVEMEVVGLQWPGEDRINLSTVFDTETEALEYMKNRCDTPGIRPVRFSSNAPTAQAADSVPAREHDLQDVRCECCGYMTYHREHMGCIHAARAPADSVQEDAARLEGKP